MATTFFATLTPGDGPNKYAGFMTRMSATLERIARVAVEKDEKRARAPDGEDQEYNPPGAKRHTSRTQTAPRSRQHRSTTLRTTMTPDTAPRYQTSSPAKQMTDISIPDTLEGLPPVNSSGYVVPMGLQDSSQSQTTHHSNPPSTISPTTNPNRLPQEIDSKTFPVPRAPAWQSQGFPAVPGAAFSAVPSTSTDSPDSFSSGTAMPEFFQMPMSGNWDYSANLFAGLFPTEYSFPPPHTLAAQSAEAYPDMSVLSAESFIHGAPAIEGHTAQAGGFDPQSLGYGYTPQGQEDPKEGADPVWPNGFLGLF